MNQGPNMLTRKADIIRASAARLLSNALHDIERPMFGSDPLFLVPERHFEPNKIEQAAGSEARYHWAVAAGASSVGWREAERDALMFQLTETERTEAQFQALELLETKGE